MNDFEIRKTRLNIVLKLFYPFITVLGALVVYLGKNDPNTLDYGNIVFLGLAAFLIVLLFTMTRYIFHELHCFNDNKEKPTTEDQINANDMYEDIFKCFSKGGLVLIYYLFVFLVLMIYSEKIFRYIEPSTTHVAIFFAVCMLLYKLPKFKTNIETTSEVTSVQPHEKKFEFPIKFEKLQLWQWSSWCILLFNLLYISWFQ